MFKKCLSATVEHNSAECNFQETHNYRKRSNEQKTSKYIASSDYFGTSLFYL